MKCETCKSKIEVKSQKFIKIPGLDFEIIPGVQLLGKSLKEAIEYANDPKNNVVLINQVADVYKIGMWLKENKEKYPEFYKQVWEDNWILADKLDETRALGWDFRVRGRPFLDSYGWLEGSSPGGGVLLGRRKTVKR